VSEVRFDSLGYDPTLLRRRSPWWGVHAARYHDAVQYVAGCRVLDVACGTGYGLPVLKSRARLVVGVDLEFEAASKALALSGTDDGEVIVADGSELPFMDGSFEVVTSFETLEHLKNRKEFLSEVRRVLIASGLCIISTPNANYTRPIDGKPRNPHHIYEYTPEELTAELNRYFADIDLFGQVLDSRFVISPFIDDQERLSHTIRTQARLLLWRAFNKMPAVVRDELSQAVWGHPLFPGEADYQFTHETVEVAPVLHALCQKIKSK